MAAGFIGTTRPSANAVTVVSYVGFTPTTTKPWLASSSAIAVSSSGGKPLGESSSTGNAGMVGRNGSVGDCM